jgi:hypothetical protein
VNGQPKLIRDASASAAAKRDIYSFGDLPSTPEVRAILAKAKDKARAKRKTV